MSLKSMKSQNSNNADILSNVDEGQTFTQIALYKGALIAVRTINKPSVVLNREDLVEMKEVGHRFRHGQR